MLHYSPPLRGIVEKKKEDRISYLIQRVCFQAESWVEGLRHEFRILHFIPCYADYYDHITGGQNT